MAARHPRLAGRGQLRSTQSSQEKTSLGAALERRMEGNRAEKRDFIRSDISNRCLGSVAENLCLGFSEVSDESSPSIFKPIWLSKFSSLSVQFFSGNQSSK